MNEPPPSAKTCPICSLELPISEFGMCRARKDGRNLYCKDCIRKKATASRRALKEYKSNQKRRVKDRYWEQLNAGEVDETPSQSVSKLTPVERIRLAIQNGARTQKEIATETKLGKDEIGDALANLLLWTHEIKTRVVDGTRIYEMNEAVEQEQPITYRSQPSLADYLLKRGPAVVSKKVRRVA